MGSTISPARANLFAALGAAFAADPLVTVAFGSPKAYEDQQMACMLGISAAEEAWALLGPQAKHDERFGIELRTKVHDPAATDGSIVDLRSFELYDTIRATVNADITLGGAVLWAIVAVPRSDGALQVDDATGWVEFIDITVACFGRAS